MPGLSDNDLRHARLEYQRDGATVLRGVLSAERIGVIGDAIDRLMQPTSAEQDQMSGEDFSGPGEGRFFNRNFSWLRDPDIKALIFDSDLPRLAGALMGSAKVRFFYDQILVKEPGTTNRTPWHQDLPYWPVRGEHIISLWVAIDAATPENGVVTYVKGSHRWNRFFAMQPFTEKFRAQAAEEAKMDIYDDAEASGQPRNLADIRDNPRNYEFLAWSVDPGDIIVHHPLTIHGSNGNSSQTMRRRAIATRWLGDDALWDDSRPNFMRPLKGRSDFAFPDLAQGAELDAPLFPLLWERKGFRA